MKLVRIAPGKTGIRKYRINAAAMEAVAEHRREHTAGDKIQFGKPGTPHTSGPTMRIA